MPVASEGREQRRPRPRLTDAWAGPRAAPTYAVDIDRAKVARLGLALPDVSATLQAVFGSVQAGNVQVVAREWPILLKIDPAGRTEVERLVQSHLRTVMGPQREAGAFVGGRDST